MKLIDAVYEVLKDSAAPMGGEELELAVRGRWKCRSKSAARVGARCQTLRASLRTVFADGQGVANTARSGKAEE